MKYESPLCEVVKLNVADVITTSQDTPVIGTDSSASSWIDDLDIGLR